MEQSSRYGPPIERHPDRTLYQMSPSQQKQAAKLIKKYCCNCDKGNCILLDDGGGCVCPQRVSYSVCCRWFRNAVYRRSRNWRRTFSRRLPCGDA